MIRSVPAIGINHGGPKESIEHNETGFLLPLDTNSWSEAIIKLVTDVRLHEEMTRKARRRAYELFSVETFSRLFNTILTENKIA